MLAFSEHRRSPPALNQIRPGMGAINQEWRSLHLPETINGELQSDEGDLGRSTHDSEILIMAAILAVWITLGMLYESVWHPLTILSTIPSAGIGAVVALDLFGLPFSGMAVIAMLLLTGISLKNAIMLVDFLSSIPTKRLARKHS